MQAAEARVNRAPFSWVELRASEAGLLVIK
jgi:hypothetical protein